MSSFKLYVMLSSDFAPNEYRAKCTEILNTYKLEKQLERNYKNVKILHTTVEIPITKKTKADALLKEYIHIDKTKTYNGRCIVEKDYLIELVNYIAKECIKEEADRILREENGKRQFEQRSKLIKKRSFDDIVSSESEETDSDDREFIAEEYELSDNDDSENNDDNNDYEDNDNNDRFSETKYQ
jgi:hypothetical protein